jgi:hypothetical protein
MKKPIVILLVLIMLSCDAESIASLGNELLSEKNYMVGLTGVCSETGFGKIWYCITKNEYDRLKELPISCENISITTINENVYRGFLSSDSLFYGEGRCNL